MAIQHIPFFPFDSTLAKSEQTEVYLYQDVIAHFQSFSNPLQLLFPIVNAKRIKLTKVVVQGRLRTTLRVVKKRVGWTDFNFFFSLPLPIHPLSIS